MIAKVDKSDFSFTIDTIDNSDFIPEKLLALKQKTHTSSLLLLIEKIHLCLVEAKFPSGPLPGINNDNVLTEMWNIDLTYCI
jgi:hypothetical protein